MNHHTLYTYVVAIAGICVIALTGGCAGSTPPVQAPARCGEVPMREILTEFMCDEAPAEPDEQETAIGEARFAALQLDLTVDHVRFIRHGTDTDQELFAAHGVPCATAGDRAGCEAELAELEARGRERRQVFAITIQGDELRLYQGREILLLLGPVDNVDKAWTVLMMQHNASSYACNEPEWTGYRELDRGYELSWVWTEQTCRPFQRVQAINHVDRTGNVTRLRFHVVEEDAERCMVDERALKRSSHE